MLKSLPTSLGKSAMDSTRAPNMGAEKLAPNGSFKEKKLVHSNCNPPNIIKTVMLNRDIEAHFPNLIGPDKTYTFPNATPITKLQKWDRGK